MQMGLLICSNKSRNSVSISCVKLEADGCRDGALCRCQPFISLCHSSHFPPAFFSIRPFSEVSVMLFKLSSFYRSAHQHSPSSSSLHLSLIPVACTSRLRASPARLSQFDFVLWTRQNKNSSGLHFEQNWTEGGEVLTCKSESFSSLVR